MRNMMKKAAQNVKAVAVRAGMLMKDTKGENYVDTAVKILIAVVLGALLLAGLYALFGLCYADAYRCQADMFLRSCANSGSGAWNRCMAGQRAGAHQVGQVYHIDSHLLS